METITRKKIEQSCLQTIAVEMGLKSNDRNTEMNLRDDLDIVSLDAMNIILTDLRVSLGGRDRRDRPDG